MTSKLLVGHQSEEKKITTYQMKKKKKPGSKSGKGTKRADS